MKYQHNRLARLGLATLLSLSLVAGPWASPSQAARVNPGTIITSVCPNQENPLWWEGGLERPQGGDWFPRGSVYYCFDVYRLTDGDSTADYYVAVARSNWTPSFPCGSPPCLADIGEAQLSHEIYSDTASYGQHSATEPFVSHNDCGQPFEVGVSAGIPGLGVSLATEVKVCEEFSVDREWEGNSSAGWHSQNAAMVRKVETMYAQRVPEGADPTFTFYFGRPLYDRYSDGNGYMWYYTARILYTSYTVDVADQGGWAGGIGGGTGGGGGGGSSGGGSSGPAISKQEPAMVRDNGDNTMKTYRWQSTGSSFGKLADYQSGTFVLSRVGNLVAAGDVDGDGKDDIVMAYQNYDNTFSFHVFKNGNKWAGIWYTSGPFALGPVAGRMVMGDFNNDGRDEPALVRDDGDNTMTIYRWTSTGSSFSHTTDFHSGTFVISRVGDLVGAGDVNGDGKDDIVMAYQNYDSTFSYHVFSAGLSWAGIWYTSGAFSLGPVAGRLVVGDFAGDGKEEPAMVRDDGDNTMTIWRWNSTGSSFSHTTDFHSGTFVISRAGDLVAAGDFDADGKDDIVIAYQNYDSTFSYHVFDSGLSWAGVWYTSGPFALGPVAGRLVVGNW